MNETILEDFLNELEFSNFSFNEVEEEDDGYTYTLYVTGIPFLSLYEKIMSSHYREKVVKLSIFDLSLLRKENIDKYWFWINYYFEDTKEGLRVSASIIGIEYLTSKGVIVNLPNKEVYDSILKSELEKKLLVT